MKVKDKCIISNETLNILLLQVTPGSEFEVKKELIKKGFGGYIFKGFGRYDIIALNESSDFSIDKFTPFENVMGKAIIYGFKWLRKNETDEKSKDKRKLGAKEFLGICCIKLDYTKPNKHKPFKTPINLDHEIADRLYTILDDLGISGSVYGGLGWNEIIFIIESSTYEKLVKAVLKIRELSISHYKDNVLIRTSTIPCVNFEMIENVIKAPGHEKLKDNVKAKIILNVAPGFELTKELAENIENYQKPYYIFGEYDVVLERDTSFDNLVKEILTLRQKFGPRSLVYSTNTLLEMEKIENPLSLDAVGKSFEVEDIKKVYDEFDKIPDKNDALKHLLVQVKHLLHIYYQTIRNPVTKKMFRDLLPIFNELKNLFFEYINARDKEKSQKIFKEINEICDLLSYNFSQRFAGLQIPYILQISDVNPSYFRENQRIILAVESLPIFLLEKVMEQKWVGLCCFGYTPEFSRYSCGIFSMPAKKLLEPQKWFGIFHEIGHEAFNLMSTEIQKMNLFDYARQAGLEGPDAKDYLDFLWEVFSDIFDYQNGFNKDWEIYFKSIWEYLLSLYGIKPTYIARSVLVYLTVGPEAKLFEDYSSEIAIQKVAEKICNDVETIQKNIKKETNNGNKLDWNLLKSEAIRLALVSLEGVKQLKNLMHERKGPILSKKELENLVSELKSGKVVDEVNPVDIIRALVITNRTNKINLVTKVSAIISLWNYTTKQISQKSDEVQLKLDKLTTME